LLATQQRLRPEQAEAGCHFAMADAIACDAPKAPLGSAFG